MTRIVVVGGLNMDLHLFGIRESGGQAPLLAERYLAQPGGKGANVARAITRLGAEVTLVGRVGDDEFGHDCVAAVAADGVDTSRVAVTSGEPTGFVAIELREGRHRSLLFAPGANNALGWTDVEPVVRGLGDGDIVIAQAEVPGEVLRALARHVATTDLTLLLDPTPADHCTPEVLAVAEAITPNRAEASALVGRSDETPLTPELAAQDLLRAGVRRVLVKMGEAGTLLADRSATTRIPTVRVTTKDETGAGDVFLAALAVRRAEGADWEPAVRFANAAAALSVVGDGLVLPGRPAVEETAATIDAEHRVRFRGDE